MHIQTYQRWLSVSVVCTLLSFSVSLPVRRLTVNLFSRKIPGLNVYAQMQNEKEQEMKSPANPTEASAGSQRDLVHSLEILDTEFSSRPIGEGAPPRPLPDLRATHLVITCFHATACVITLILCRFFLFLRSEKVMAVEGRTRDRKEQCNNTLFFFSNASTVLNRPEISDW